MDQKHFTKQAQTHGQVHTHQDNARLGPYQIPQAHNSKHQNQVGNVELPHESVPTLKKAQLASHQPQAQHRRQALPIGASGKHSEQPVDPSSVLKQMSQDQVVQLLKDPEIARIFKESMLQNEKEQSKRGRGPSWSGGRGKMIDLEDIMPLESDDGESQHGARPYDPFDPSIVGNEFEVPQEKTLNTEDFAFTGLPASAMPKQRPKLYMGPPDGFPQELNTDMRDDVLVQMDQEIAPQDKKVFTHLQSICSEGVGAGQINYEAMAPQSSSSSSEQDFDLAFQLFDGEEMTAGLANFIGIHRMQSLNSGQSTNQVDALGPEANDRGSQRGQLQKGPGHLELPFAIDSDELKEIFTPGAPDDSQEDEEQYFCPVTGAHFHKANLYKRILKLQKRRALIDNAIEEEYRMQREAEAVKLSKTAKAAAIYKTSDKQQAAIGSAKSGRNTSSQLGHGRQNLTDGNTYKPQQRHDQAQGTSSPLNAKSLQQPFGDLFVLQEDQQAIIIQPGKAKYGSNQHPVKAKSSHAAGQLLASAASNNTKNSLQGGESGASKGRYQTTTVRQTSNSQGGGFPGNRRLHDSGRAGMAFQQQLAQLAQQQSNPQVNNKPVVRQEDFDNKPPHERLLNFAQAQQNLKVIPGKSPVVRSSIDHQHAQTINAKQPSNLVVSSSSRSAKKHSKQPKITVLKDQQNQRNTSGSSITQQSIKQLVNGAQKLLVAKGSLDPTSQLKTRLQVQKTSNVTSIKRNSSQKGAVYHQAAHAHPSQPPSKVTKQGARGFESLSFDNRRQQKDTGSISKHLITRGSLDQDSQVDQNSQITVAYRSMQDQRKKVALAQHESAYEPMSREQKQAVLHSYNSQRDSSKTTSAPKYSLISANQINQKPSQVVHSGGLNHLVSVKQSQVETSGVSRGKHVSRISIQKAKTRQKQILQAVLSQQQFQETTRGTQKGGKVNQAQASNPQNQLQTFQSEPQSLAVQNQVAQSSTFDSQSRNTVSSAIASQNNRIGNADATFKKRKGQKEKVARRSSQDNSEKRLQEQHSQHEPAESSREAAHDNQTHNQSQIQQIEQFYAMLSGHQVQFGRQNQRVNQGMVPKAESKQAKVYLRPQKPQRSARQQAKNGTHARTNTFDSRAVPGQQPHQAHFKEASDQTDAQSKLTLMSQIVNAHQRQLSKQNADLNSHQPARTSLQGAQKQYSSVGSRANQVTKARATHSGGGSHQAVHHQRSKTDNNAAALAMMAGAASSRQANQVGQGKQAQAKSSSSSKLKQASTTPGSHGQTAAARPKSKSVHYAANQFKQGGTNQRHTASKKQTLIGNSKQVPVKSSSLAMESKQSHKDARYEQERIETEQADNRGFGQNYDGDEEILSQLDYLESARSQKLGSRGPIDKRGATGSARSSIQGQSTKAKAVLAMKKSSQAPMTKHRKANSLSGASGPSTSQNQRRFQAGQDESESTAAAIMQNLMFKTFSDQRDSGIVGHGFSEQGTIQSNIQVQSSSITQSNRVKHGRAEAGASQRAKNHASVDKPGNAAQAANSIELVRPKGAHRRNQSLYGAIPLVAPSATEEKALKQAQSHQQSTGQGRHKKSQSLVPASQAQIAKQVVANSSYLSRPNQKRLNNQF